MGSRAFGTTLIVLNILFLIKITPRIGSEPVHYFVNLFLIVLGAVLVINSFRKT